MIIRSSCDAAHSKARIGRDVRFFDYSYFGSGIPGDEEAVAFAEQALDVMGGLGATVVNTDTGDVFAYADDELPALLDEFKAQIADYLATLSHTNMRTLADLIAFNVPHCEEELGLLRVRTSSRRSATSGYLPTRICGGAHARSKYGSTWN